MTTYSKRTLEIQPLSSLPLFSWRTVVVRPSTVAGNFVARRYGIQPQLADLVADLAGLGTEVK